MVNVNVDLTAKVKDLPYSSLSSTVSTYGKPITTETVLRNNYAKIAKGSLIRIPFQWNNGNPCSSAGGGPKNISADDWVNAIKQMGASLQIVIGGTNDNNFSATDAANLVKKYHPDSIVMGNEFDNGGMSLSDYINKVFKPAAQAVRSADPNVKIAGAAWASYKSGEIKTFIDSCKGLFDIIDWHNYGTGQNAPGDDQLMGYTPTYESQVNSVRTMLTNAGQNNVVIQIGELNLAWQFNDGYKGGSETRFFTAYNTAWIASSIGHILIAGGRELVYSNQNGPLGFFVEPGNQDQGKPSGTPTPAGYGMEMFTGDSSQADKFPTFGNAIMKASSDNANAVEAYAGSGGNIVVINKSGGSQSAALTIKGASDGSKTTWSSDVGSPYSPPKQGSVNVSGGKATLNLQGYQVITLVTGTPSSGGGGGGGGTTPPPDTGGGSGGGSGGGGGTTPPTPTPDPSATGMPVVQFGTKGDDASAVQQLLRMNGYTSQGVNADFGYSSQDNVKDFQGKNGLKVTGVVENTTYRKLIGNAYNTYGPK